MSVKRACFFALFATLAPVLTILPALAESVPPAGRDTPVSATFDRGTPPSTLGIWTHESGGYDTEDPRLWGRNNWRCLSNTSPETGQCKSGEAKNANGDWGATGDTLIPTLFTEKKSGLQAVINLKGYHSSSADGTHFLVTAGADNGAKETFLYMFINGDELKKLPVGGVWEGTLALDLWQWSPGKNLARWTAHITLNVTDNNNQQIYLPEFGEAAPLVNLNMRPLPGAGTQKMSFTGRANIDVCLYDGYNANSSTFMLTLNDDFTGQSDRSGLNFSIVRQGGNVNEKRDRIDYTINILNPDTNTMQTVSRARQINFTKIQQAHIRQVHLPGIPEPVICVPAPLELSTDYIEVSSKNAGYYRGTLQLNFTPSLY
ncbi:CfaE/CblD family pilus tip adhesin [Rahnella aceris]|uniref:CfaE/CblD family pilus tip adhesin n=1 Tax=Rahnella sp. (strain Y9602) TaxID=2703885 RepID=UPI000DC28016